MSETASIEQRLEKLSTEAKNTFAKVENAVRGAYDRVENRGNELLDNLVKTGEKRQKTQAKAAKKSTKAEPSTLDQLRNRAADVLGFPTRDEVEALNKKIASLNRKVNKMAKDAKAAK